MDTLFDISQDELPIFLAETDEHLQTLDDVLIELERGQTEAGLVNTAFRAAHTLKGMAGMIGHQRMTSLTHALETAFDRVRKNDIAVDTALVDLCLEAVDNLRLLRDEVETSRSSGADVTILVSQFEQLNAVSNQGNRPQPPVVTETVSNQARRPQPAASETASHQDDRPRPAATETGSNQGDHPQPTASETIPVVDQPRKNGHDADHDIVHVLAAIDPSSVASAARAFQLYLTLQDLGEIVTIFPTIEQIDTSAPVKFIAANLRTTKACEEVSSKLAGISEVQVMKSAPGSVDVTQMVSALATEPQQVFKNPEPAPAPQAERAQAEPTNGAQRAVSSRRAADLTVRTSVERLDNLMNLVGELITDRNHLFQLRNRLAVEDQSGAAVDHLAETVAHLGRVTDQLQEEVMRIRMLPIGNVFHKFPRLVRDLSQKTGKQVDLIMQGEDTELDRSMIEEINDPLIHLVRNAIDHGIELPEKRLAAGKPERGTVRLTARHEQGRILLTVEDDGRGIDSAKLRRSAVQKGLLSEVEAEALSEEQAVDLIFLPGLSTANELTDISGRGVGMDIVRNNIQRVNGTVAVETTPGVGTIFQIILPLTLAIVPTLLVCVSDTHFAIPLVMVTETLRLAPSDLRTIRGKPVTILRGNVLPMVHLHEIFAVPHPEVKQGNQYVVVVNSGKQRVGLVVDSLIGEEEVVVKSLGAFIGDLPGISSAAILGDGRLALIVDVPGLFRLTGIH